MFRTYLSPAAQQLYSGIRAHISLAQRQQLDEVLELSFLEALARDLPQTNREYCLILLKADDPVTPAWLLETSPSTKLVIEEFLLRTLLSLTVQ